MKNGINIKSQPSRLNVKFYSPYLKVLAQCDRIWVLKAPAVLVLPLTADMATLWAAFAYDLLLLSLDIPSSCNFCLFKNFHYTFKFTLTTVHIALS